MKTNWIRWAVVLLISLFRFSISPAWGEIDSQSTQSPVKKIILGEVTIEVGSLPFKGEDVQIASKLETEAAVLLKEAIEEGNKILNQMEEWNQRMKSSTVQTLNQKNKASIQLTDAIERFFVRLETLRQVDSAIWLRLFREYSNSSASKALSALDKNFSSFRTLPAAN